MIIKLACLIVGWKSAIKTKSIIFFIFVTVFSGIIMVKAQNQPCKFDEKTLQFVGTPVEQARCLLRPVLPRGVLGSELKQLPTPLEELIGTQVLLKKVKLRKYLEKHKIDESVLGGSLDEPLAKAKLPTGEELQTQYFIIHDTSAPNYLLELFPPEINTKQWKPNTLETWLNQPVAHIFVNRPGESITTTPFSETVRKGWGTKFARDFLKADGKALQLHIELIQPRRSDPTWFKGNDAFSPSIGFTVAQYERLALLYVIASIRRGTWLIPAYHCAIDAGIKDAHDDPQNFELHKFSKEVKNLKNKFK